ncbi:PIN domain-like protein, partial [Cubamyces sp. BRFM 1775]
PLHVIFVVDGPLRPHMKRKKKVKTAPHWLTEGMQQFARAFGYAWIEAAGEAEAEMARMNQLGVIDLVLTEDSDALVFGALTVARNPSYKRTDTDTLAVYRASDILRDEGLSRGDLLLLALLLGSDYDPSGLPRCGSTIARGLVRYGLGRSLYAAILSSSDAELATFVPRWRSSLCEKLRTDPSNLIGRQCPSLAASVPHTFPDANVARLFGSPTVLNPERYADILMPSPMNISRIGELCELYFTWGSRAEILKTFRTSLWPGEAVRMLILEGLASP